MSVPAGSSSPFNLEFLRKDAKRLLRSARAGDPTALARIRGALSRAARIDDGALRLAVKLADAQHAIAREHGHSIWADLTRHDNPLERFLVAVRGGALRQIVEHLAEFAPLGSVSVHAACALGDRVALERHLVLAPGASVALHREWSPLAYVCASPLNKLSARHSAGLLDCARLLLDHDADPNNMTPASTDGPARQAARLFDREALPVYVRAMMNANMPLTLLLQQRGVSPKMSMMPAMATLEEQSPVMSRVFREYFGRPDVHEKMKALMAETQGLYGNPASSAFPLDLRALHAPKSSGLPGMQHDVWNALLERGYDAAGRQSNGQTALHAMARTGQADLLELALVKGIDPSLRDADGRSVIAVAVRAGHEDVVAVLRRHGATLDDVTPIDRLLGACMRMAGDEALAIVATQPSWLRRLQATDFDALIRCVVDAREDRLALMLASGFPPGGLGENGATALHLAAWLGHVEIVRRLLSHGARGDIRDTTYGQTPAEWAIHGSVHCRDAADDYADIISALNGPPT